MLLLHRVDTHAVVHRYHRHTAHFLIEYKKIDGIKVFKNPAEYPKCCLYIEQKATC